MILPRIFSSWRDMGLSTYLSSSLEPKEYISALLAELAKSKANLEFFFENLKEEISARANSSSPARLVRLLMLVDHVSDHFPVSLNWLRNNLEATKINDLLESNVSRMQQSEGLLLKNYARFISLQLARTEAPANELEVNVRRLELIAILARNMVNLILRKMEPLFITLQQRAIHVIHQLHSCVLGFLKRQLVCAEGLSDKAFAQLYDCYGQFAQLTKHIDLFLHVQKLVLPPKLGLALEQRYDRINPSFSVEVGGSNDSTLPVSEVGTLGLDLANEPLNA